MATTPDPNSPSRRQRPRSRMMSWGSGGGRTEDQRPRVDLTESPREKARNRMSMNTKADPNKAMGELQPGMERKNEHGRQLLIKGQARFNTSSQLSTPCARCSTKICTAMSSPTPIARTRHDRAWSGHWIRSARSRRRQRVPPADSIRPGRRPRSPWDTAADEAVITKVCERLHSGYLSALMRSNAANSTQATAPCRTALKMKATAVAMVGIPL
jgi:hypothetical protein